MKKKIVAFLFMFTALLQSCFIDNEVAMTKDFKVKNSDVNFAEDSNFIGQTSTQSQTTCSQCSTYNCAFDGITGECRVTCGVNYSYSVGGILTQAPTITGGTLINFSGSSFIVNWTCGEYSGAIEAIYTNNGRNYLTEGQVCICPLGSGGNPGGGNPGGGNPGGGSSNYCELVNLNCAMDGITGPCNVIVGTSATYSVSTRGTITWRVNINGSISVISGNPINITWPSPGLYVAEIEVLRNGLHFTEGMVCVDIN